MSVLYDLFKKITRTGSMAAATNKYTPEVLKTKLFKFTSLENIKINWPLLLTELEKRDLLDKEMLLYSLATIYVECDIFKPVAEGISKWNTDKEPFDKYIGKLGNINLTMAQLYRGSGMIQCTGYVNYKHFDDILNLKGKLIKDGYIYGKEPLISASIFAEYMDERKDGIRTALNIRDFKKARSYVNGNYALHWEKLKTAYEILETI